MTQVRPWPNGNAHLNPVRWGNDVEFNLRAGMPNQSETLFVRDNIVLPTSSAAFGWGGFISGITGVSWTPSAASAANNWRHVAWSPELGIFCAVSGSGTGNRVMTSLDGVTWDSQVTPADNSWRCVAWSRELGIFCAVSSTGTNRAMTSHDGVTWTARPLSNLETWFSINWVSSLGYFVAVASNDDDGSNMIATSSDGISWTSHPTTPASGAFVNGTNSIAWSPELRLFSCCSSSLFYTSPNGITWTSREKPTEISSLFGSPIVWSPELMRFCSLAFRSDGTNVSLISLDGINWQIGSVVPAVGPICWCAELGLFVGIASIITSFGFAIISADGLNWSRTNSSILSGTGFFNALCWSPRLKIFCGVAGSGSANRVIISGLANP